MNESQFQESIDTFKVRFEGSTSIDAELFTKTINNTIELVKASSRAIDPNAFLRLEIKNTITGTKEISFEIIVHALAKITEELTNKDNNLASEIILETIALLNLKSHLKGQKPKEISAG